MKLTQDRFLWRAFVNTVMAYRLGLNINSTVRIQL